MSLSPSSLSEINKHILGWGFNNKKGWAERKRRGKRKGRKREGEEGEREWGHGGWVGKWEDWGAGEGWGETESLLKNSHLDSSSFIKTKALK